MTTAAAAAEYKAHLGPDFALVDAFDTQYRPRESPKGCWR